MSLPAQADVLVVGAGIMGLAVSWQLAEMGRAVTLMDQYSPGHDFGSSHGGTRGHRYSYEDPVYARLAMDAELWWRVLERRSGQTLLTMTGGVDIGVPGTESFDRTLATVRELGLEHSLVAAGTAAAAKLAPFRLPPGTAALVQPGAGLISAARAVKTLEQLARDASVSILTPCRVSRIEAGKAGSAVVVVDRDGGEHAVRAQAVVLAAGGWTAQIVAGSAALQLPDPFPLQVLACEPVYFRFSGPAPESLFFLHPDEHFPQGMYGQSQRVAGEPELIKLGIHGGQAVNEPGEPASTEALVDAQALGNRIEQVMPGATGARYAGSDRCYYTMSPDEQFIIDRTPGLPSVTVVAGFSGHGFKFAPLVGRAVAELVADGGTSIAIDGMGLSRTGI